MDVDVDVRRDWRSKILESEVVAGNWKWKERSRSAPPWICQLRHAPRSIRVCASALPRSRDQRWCHVNVKVSDRCQPLLFTARNQRNQRPWHKMKIRGAALWRGCTGSQSCLQQERQLGRIQPQTITTPQQYLKHQINQRLLPHQSSQELHPQSRTVQGAWSIGRRTDGCAEESGPSPRGSDYRGHSGRPTGHAVGVVQAVCPRCEDW